jgi:hypothetical protein
MQKMCLLWQIKVSCDVMVLGVINSEYKSTFLKNGENCSLCHTIPHSRMPLFSTRALQQPHYAIMLSTNLFYIMYIKLLN